MKAKKLRVERFLDEMNAVVPWCALVEEIKPYYKGDGGRPPHDLELMLRVHFLQLWNNLSDPALEEALYDRLSFQKFLGFDCFGGVVPDESSICRFRHLLEQHDLSQKILSCVNGHLMAHGLVLKEGTIVDATLLQAPVSKKNARKERDPEMSSTRKNNKWYFGAKGHIGVQAPRPALRGNSFRSVRSTLASRSFIQQSSRRLRRTTFRRWKVFFTAMKNQCLATVLTAATRIKSERVLRVYITGSVTKGDATTRFQRRRKRKTASIPAFAPKSSTRFGSLNICGDIAKCVTKGCTKTPRDLRRCAPCPISFCAERMCLLQDNCA
jgi:transposase